MVAVLSTHWLVSLSPSMTQKYEYEMARFTHKKSQWESLEKNIGQGRCFGARAASGKEVSAMEITIPLSHFVAYLNEVKVKGRTWPYLNPKDWLLENFRFDDENAAYDPPVLMPRDYTAWMLKHSRN
jgi:hypothetical protein